MSLYVDTPIFERRGQLWCHMIADNHKELQEAAEAIGLKTPWIQKAGTALEHYDLSPEKRRLAVSHGAVEISCRDLGQKCRERRRQQEALDELTRMSQEMGLYE